MPDHCYRRGVAGKWTRRAAFQFSSRSSGYYATLTTLKQIADRFGLTILLVHHTRKQEADDAVDKISGTTGLIGCADGSLILEKEERLGTRGSLTITSREHSDMKLLLDFDRDAKIWKFLSYADSKADEPEDPILRAVHQLLQNVGNWKGTATELLPARWPQKNQNILRKDPGRGEEKASSGREV